MLDCGSSARTQAHTLLCWSWPPQRPLPGRYHQLVEWPWPTTTNMLQGKEDPCFPRCKCGSCRSPPTFWIPWWTDMGCRWHMHAEVVCEPPPLRTFDFLHATFGYLLHMDQCKVKAATLGTRNDYPYPPWPATSLPRELNWSFPRCWTANAWPLRCCNLYGRSRIPPKKPAFDRQKILQATQDDWDEFYKDWPAVSWDTDVRRVPHAPSYQVLSTRDSEKTILCFQRGHLGPLYPKDAVQEAYYPVPKDTWWVALTLWFPAPAANRSATCSPPMPAYCYENWA